MANSQEINELASALVAAQAEFSAVPKGSNNPFFKSKYAALPDVVASASPVLAKHGLAVSQGISFVETASGLVDTLTTTLLHKSGQFTQDTMLLHLPKSDPQGQGSAVTYARRYSYMAILGLVADDDDDGNAASRPKARPTGVSEMTAQVSKNGQVMLKALLAKQFPDAADRKAYLESKVGRTLSGIGELTENEIGSITQDLQEKEAVNNG